MKQPEETMYITVQVLLVLFARVMFVLAGRGLRCPARFQYVPWGLFAWLLWMALPLLRATFAVLSTR